MDLAPFAQRSAPSAPDVSPVAGSFPSLPPIARAAVAIVIAAGIVLAAWHVRAPQAPDPLLFVTLLLAASACAAFSGSLPRASRGPTSGLTSAVAFASLLLVGPDATIAIVATSAFIESSFGSQAETPGWRAAFAMGASIITAHLAALVIGPSAVGPSPGAAATIVVGQPVVLAAAVWVTCFTALEASSSILTGDRQSLESTGDEALWTGLGFFVGVMTAVSTVRLAAGSGWWLTPIILAPVYVTYRIHRRHVQRVEGQRSDATRTRELHMATMEALAAAIDAKDQTATAHVRRVQIYATGLARALGMSEDEIQGLRTAALLHDIGKLGVPEHILSKPGPLTPDEFQKVQTHAQIGAEILAAVPFPYPVAPLILAHHEQWDGHGYPLGWKGEEIPLGARILSVVDHFDAITSDRPHHGPYSFDQAIAALRQEAGAALDPAIVDLFLKMLPDLQREAARVGEPERRLAFLTANHEVTRRPAVEDVPDEARPTNVYRDIALAHREIYALYELAQSMGTSLGVSETMAIIASKLSKLVPFSTCALFLYDEAEARMTCRFATGIDDHVISRLRLDRGEGLVGWVAANKRPLVNGRPAADLEAADLDAETTLAAALICPLVFNEKLIGALALYHVRPRWFTDDHRRLLDRVAEQAAGVVNNSIVYEQTKHDSLTDPLTGLPNTRFMFVHLTRELARAARLCSEVSLLVMDLDAFKDINDRWGHHVGDRALREVAHALRAGIRPYDICVRYAGDEFVVVLSGCSAEEADQKKRELQQAIGEIAFEVRPGRIVALSASFGCASFPIDGETYEALLATADERMYDDKAARKRANADPASPDAVRPSMMTRVPQEPAKRTH
jgi:diguanylate cyclase (GGDEF)-like protein/putative nucleotidyltransferase with HDIG domain